VHPYDLSDEQNIAWRPKEHARHRQKILDNTDYPKSGKVRKCGDYRGDYIIRLEDNKII